MSIEKVPPPWTCHCTMWWLMFTLPADAELPEEVYAPLELGKATPEGRNVFAHSVEGGRFRGGLGSVQIVRYSDSPAGPYDELLIAPGSFEVPGTRDVCNRITRIYVSQKKTCYNGRRNWGIPKHLARFSFTYAPAANNGATVLKAEVFPPDPNATKPFFSAILQPFSYLPPIPISTRIMPYIPGIDARVVQPPIPASVDPEKEELSGSDHWFRIFPGLSSKRARLMWVDQKMPTVAGAETGDTKGSIGGKEEADPTKLEEWWPAIKPWKVGLWLDQAILEFPDPEILDIE